MEGVHQRTLCFFSTLFFKLFLFFFFTHAQAFLPQMHNWLCNTAHMEGVHQRTLLLFSDDGDQALKV
jgi:hypothetical protein